MHIVIYQVASYWVNEINAFFFGKRSDIFCYINLCNGQVEFLAWPTLKR